MRPRVSRAEFERAVLLALYQCALEHPDTGIFLDDAPQVVGCGGQLAMICVEALCEKKLVERFQKAGRIGIRMTRDGVDEVDSWDDGRYSNARKLFQPDAERDTGARFEDEMFLIPASDRTVTLNHNQPEYLEAVEALDEAIEAFDQDHCLDNELGPEKNVLRKSLEVARDYFRLKEINVRVGVALIVEQLQYVAKKYENAIAGAALGQLFRLAADKIMAVLN